MELRNANTGGTSAWGAAGERLARTMPRRYGYGGGHD